MKFRFCGDLDCPDWVLAEISILSRISSVKMKLLSLQVVKSLCGEAIDYAKVQKFTSDAKFEHSDVKASIAALSFILSSAARYSVDGDSLSNELQQLGLPREHSISLHKVYEDNLTKLQDHLRNTSFRLDKLKDLEWRVDYVLGSSQMKDLKEPEINLRFVTVNSDSSSEQPVSMTMTSDKFTVLLHELKQAYKTMEGLS
ncbi:COMM domain-containing protein 4-like [Dendronephthya gigantea]|uniref:COMM domain-containing protein 4-like n=1 Tax=Dendronephthya gigantea TaxID=151771 RepID=UPI00106AFF87|nr:COMM domain-containing protein 4-like [Dendronephthya gigantea]